MKRKISFMVLASVVVLALAGCSGEATVETPASDPVASEEVTSETSEAENSSQIRVCEKLTDAILQSLVEIDITVDQKSYDFVKYYGDGYYYDTAIFYESYNQCAYTQKVQEKMGAFTYEEMCELLGDDGNYMEFRFFELDSVAVRIPGTYIVVEHIQAVNGSMGEHLSWACDNLINALYTSMLDPYVVSTEAVDEFINHYGNGDYHDTAVLYDNRNQGAFTERVQGITGAYTYEELCELLIYDEYYMEFCIDTSSDTISVRIPGTDIVVEKHCGFGY